MKRVAALAAIVLAGGQLAACAFDFAFLDTAKDAGGEGPLEAGTHLPEGGPGPGADGGVPDGEAGTGHLGDNEAGAEAGALAFRRSTIALGPRHACAIMADTTLRCWGSSTAGELGRNEPIPGADTTISAPAPVVIDANGTALTGVTAVSAGIEFTCAIAAGKAVCFGTSDQNQLGCPVHASPIAVPVCGGATVLASNVAAIASGQRSACAITGAGTLVCWGANDNLVADPLSTDDVLQTPHTLNFAKYASVVGFGTQVACVVQGDVQPGAHGDGSLLCWGADDTGQVGTTDAGRCPSGSGACVATPYLLPFSTTKRVVDVAGGRTSTCAATEDGNVFCWGNNLTGQTGLPVPAGCTGTGVTECPQDPTMIPSFGGIVRVGLGNSHGCALRSDHTVWCWGANYSGQIATGAADSDAHRPTQVQLAAGSPLENIVDLVVYADTTCVRRADDNIFCWGEEVPPSDSTTRTSPTVVPL